jgi:hypothetical protein
MQEDQVQEDQTHTTQEEVFFSDKNSPEKILSPQIDEEKSLNPSVEKKSPKKKNLKEKISSEEEKEVLPKEIEAIIKDLSSFEDKIKELIGYMHKMISQEKAPDFRSFWAAKRFCLTLFKEPLSSAFRGHYWAEYMQISDEGKRLKDLLDEQSLFAIEQMDLAIDSLDKDIKRYTSLVQEMGVLNFPKSTSSLLKDVHFYEELQRELTLLNALGTRLHGLRKEVMSTDMRIREKNKLLKKISLLGDFVFPKRKEQISKLSNAFQEDVEKYLTSFEEYKRILKDPLYKCKEEIKDFQQLAKMFTLEPRVLTHTRITLSTIWDKIKEAEKEKKEKFLEKKEEFEANKKLAEKKLEEIQASLSTLLPEKARDLRRDVLHYLSSLKLLKEDHHALKDRLFVLFDGIFDKEKVEKEKVLEEKKQRKIDEEKNVIHALEALKKLFAEEAVDKIQEGIRTIKEGMNIEKLRPLDKLTLESLLARLEDRIFYDEKDNLLQQKIEEKENRLSLSKQILLDLQERKKSIKTSLEQHRKACGESGLDFEMALIYQDLFREEKNRLQKVEQKIEEIEDQIYHLEES